MILIKRIPNNAKLNYSIYLILNFADLINLNKIIKIVKIINLNQANLKI
jgi:hypothetical protein